MTEAKNAIATALAEPFPAECVSWRVGSTTSDKKRGMALAYVDARAVMDRLDAVLGPENWQDDYTFSDKRILCRISVKLYGEWISKCDGAGDTDVEPEKGGISDAFKRAAVKWGPGRYLYGMPSPWVEIEPCGKSFKIKTAELPKLREIVRAASGPDCRQSDDTTVSQPEQESEPDPHDEILRRFTARAISVGFNSDVVGVLSRYLGGPFADAPIELIRELWLPSAKPEWWGVTPREPGEEAA